MTMPRPDPYELFPTLRTPRLVLREPRETDADALFRIYADEQVMRGTNAEPFSDPDEADALLRAWRGRYEERRGIRWILAPAAGGDAIGMCGYILTGPRKLDLGYLLAPEHWRHGLMKEAVSAILPVAFEGLNAVRVEAAVHVDNVASCRLVESLGFSREGVLRQSAFHRGSFHDVCMYALLRDEFRVLQRIRG